MIRRPASSPRFLVCGFALLLLGTASPQCPQLPDPGTDPGTGGTTGPAIAAALVASGFDQPVQVTAPEGDPRLFVVERTGRILILKDGAVLPQPFLDLSPLLPVGVV